MLRVFVIACGAVLVQGCTVVVSADEEQCETVADCTERGFANAACVDAVCVEEATPWGCLGNVVEPVPDPSRTVEFPMKLVFASDGNGIGTDAVVDICDKLDPGCTGTDPRFPKGLSPDADGFIQVAVPEGFDGFVRIADADIVDSRIYVGRPLFGAPTPKEIQLLRPDEYAIFATLSGQELDPTRGTAILYVVDCTQLAAGGVRFESPNADADTVQFYLINQAPVQPPAAPATDGDGFGGLFNMPAGAALVRAFRYEDDTYVGESSFQIVGDTISYVQVAPTPQ